MLRSFPRPLCRLPVGLLLCLGLLALPRPALCEDLPLEGSGEVQRALEDALADAGLTQATRDERLGVALVRLSETGPDSGAPEPPGFDGLGLVNGHRMFYAASLPKIVILYGAAVALDQERAELDAAFRRDLVDMIRRSCNPCANRVLDRVGRDWLVALMESGPHRFYDPEAGGGLWVGKDYARTPAFGREPLRNLSHAATAWQAARFYFLLVRGELASPERTALMLEALVDPAIAHKFVAGLEDRSVDRLYRKSGTWRRHHSDSALVVSEEGSYILVALARDERGGAWLERLAAAVHDRLLGPDASG